MRRSRDAVAPLALAANAVILATACSTLNINEIVND